MRIDQVMLGQMAREEELGLYGVAVAVAEVASLASMILYTAFYASLVRAQVRAPERFEEHMQRLYDIMAVASYAIMIAVAVLSMVFFVPIFGLAYTDALPMVLVLLLSLPPVFLGGAVSAMLTIRGWLWTLPVMTAAGALANVLLNIALIPSLGGMGAAWATVVSYWLAGYGICFMLPWLRPAGWRITRALGPFGAIRRIIATFRQENEAGRGQQWERRE